jgi:hypothetical protein
VTDPTLVPRDALHGRRVALSVSDSEDLGRLGLTPAHLELVVAEVARAVILAGGIIAYGGRIKPAGFTQLIIDEVERYGADRVSLELFVPSSEHQDVPIGELEEIDRRLGIAGQLYLLTQDGEPQTIPQRRKETAAPRTASSAETLTAMRKQVSELTDARIILGGKLTGFKGIEPGVIEEARLTVQAGKALYVAGGYGGAASAVAQTLEFDRFEWAPPSFPVGADTYQVQSALSSLQTAYAAAEPADGLSEEQRRVLAISHRPANIATAVVLGLSSTNAPDAD